MEDDGSRGTRPQRVLEGPDEGKALASQPLPTGAVQQGHIQPREGIVRVRPGESTVCRGPVQVLLPK